MEYTVGDWFEINVGALVKNGGEMTHVEVEEEEWNGDPLYSLFIEAGYLACMSGEPVMIDHLVDGTDDLYDLVSAVAGDDVHFKLSKHDIEIASRW